MSVPLQLNYDEDYGGPVFLLPTGGSDTLSARQWGFGPTAVALKQEGPWTIGALANHLSSVAGDSDRARLSTTFVQPSCRTRRAPPGPAR